MKKSVKITYIGGGSNYWARQFITDLALCAELSGELILQDIHAAAAERNRVLAGELFRHPDARTHFDVAVVADLAQALDGADFVVISIEPGPLECRRVDLEIPEKFGILQTVGDTTGPGGFLRAMRCLSDYTVFAEAIREHCPKAWVINYTNPMTLCTAMLYRVFPDIRAFGCCHEVFGTQRMFARLVEHRLGVPKPHHKEIELDLAGVNHFTFVDGARWKGEDVFRFVVDELADPACFSDRTATAMENLAAGHVFHNSERIALDLLRRTGALGAAGDRHLVEFVPYYLESWESLHRFGIIRTDYAYRVRANREKSLAKPVSADVPLAASDEEGVALLCALSGGAPLLTNVNLPNRGQVDFLPDGAIVETFAEVGLDAMHPVTASMLTAPARALIQRVASVQCMALDAIMARDRTSIVQALMLDPLVSLPTNEAFRLFDEMLDALHQMGHLT